MSRPTPQRCVEDFVLPTLQLQSPHSAVVTLAVPRSVLEQTPALNMSGELERLQLCLCLSTRSSTDEKQLKFAIVKRGPVSTDHLLAEDAFEWSHGRF